MAATHIVLVALLVVVVAGGHANAAPVSPAPIVCAHGDPGVRCLRNPCTTPCPVAVALKLTCVPNYCSKRTVYLGTPLPTAPCSAVYVNPSTSKVYTSCDKIPCPPDYKPVCAHGTVYLNACVAKKLGVTSYTFGPCISGPCAKCINKCATIHSPCKFKPKYECRTNPCKTKVLNDKLQQVTLPLCSASFYNVKTGLLASEC